jgi:hypothetical protein
MVRQWTCAMMISFMFYYTYAEAMVLCNDELFSILLHLC